MYELFSTKAEKGNFEYELRKKAPWYCRLAIKLGPLKGRVITFTIVILAAFMKFTNQPAQWLVDLGWMSSYSENLYYLQLVLSWGMAIAGMVMWGMVIFFQQEKLHMVFDRPNQEVHFFKHPLGAKNPVQESLVPFKLFNSIKVFSAKKSPETDHGFIELACKDDVHLPEGKVRFKVLSQEQLEIFPNNFMNLLDIEPSGDWVEPA